VGRKNRDNPYHESAGKKTTGIMGALARAAVIGVEKALAGGGKECGVKRGDGKGLCKRLRRPGQNTCGSSYCEAVRNMRGVNPDVDTDDDDDDD
jgi:hypothetical protein